MARRIIAALVFSLQLNVLALAAGLVSIGNPACDRMSGSPSQAAGMSGMQNMDMSTAPTGDERGGTPDKPGCNLPWALGCTSDAPCSPTATIGVSRLRVLPLATAMRIAGCTMQAPDSPVKAPELPPPRV